MAAFAADATAVSTATAMPTACPSPGESLGVSRVVEVDTQGGPGFGDQYPGTTLLAPGEVVLTFDDGPFPHHTESILAALAAQCTKATFFQVGSMAKAYPEIARKVLHEGHTIGSHTWSHANLARLSPASGRSQIERGIAAQNTILPGAVAPFFRFPYLNDSKPMRAYLRSRDIAVFSIDVDSIDYRAKSADQMVRTVMSGLSKTGGGIILMHDIHAVTATALPSLLRSLKEKNFKVVHLVPKRAIEPVAMNEPPASDGPTTQPKRHMRLSPGRQGETPPFKWFDW